MWIKPPLHVNAGQRQRRWVTCAGMLVREAGFAHHGHPMPDAIDRQPELTSARLHLRPLRADDWTALYAVASDPLIWAVHPARNRWQEPVFRRYFDEGLACGGALAIIDPVEQTIIGSSRYGLERAGPDEVEIGWTFLARRYWGGDMNAELKRLMVGHALRYMPRVIFIVGEDNLRSRRAMQKIGGRLTDRVVDSSTPGIIGRHVVFAIDRQDFADGPLMQRHL